MLSTARFYAARQSCSVEGTLSSVGGLSCPSYSNRCSARGRTVLHASAFGCPFGDFEGRGRSAGRTLRPVLLAARRVEPLRCTGLPLLTRRTTESPLETRGCDPDDRQAALSRCKFGDGFCLDGFDRRLKAARRRSEECDGRASALAGAVEDGAKYRILQLR